MRRTSWLLNVCVVLFRSSHFFFFFFLDLIFLTNSTKVQLYFGKLKSQPCPQVCHTTHTSPSKIRGSRQTLGLQPFKQYVIFLVILCDHILHGEVPN